MMMSRNLTITVLVVVLLVVGVWFISRPQPQPVVSPSTPPAIPSYSQEATTPAQTTQQREIMVEGREFQFSPSSISLNKGEKIKITFQNKGKLPHNLTISELSLATKTISSGQEDSLEFVADRDGSFTMFCSVGNHRAQGLEGSIVIK